MAVRNPGWMQAPHAALWIAACVAAAVYAGPVPAAGDPAPVALVMQVTGTTDPPLARHREIADGKRIVVSARSSVALLHYGTCSIVTLNGGTATVTAQGVETPAANIASTKPGPCPRVHKIALAGQTASGGVSVSRGVDPAANALPSTAAPINLASNGVIVLAGANSGKAQTYELRDGYGRAIGKSLPIKDGMFTLDGSESARGPYTIRITFAKPIEPVDVQVFLSRSTDGGMLVLQGD